MDINFSATIGSMTRDIEKWWALRKLQKTTDIHTEKMLSSKDIADGNVIADGRNEFIRWLADSSINAWLWRPKKLWKYRYKLWREKDIEKKKKLRDEFHSKRTGWYNSIVGSCTVSNLILIHEKDGIKHLHTTPSGDDFVSSFWWKQTIGHPITTAIIIMVLGGILVYYTTERIKGLKSPENQIYQIQLVPYEPK